MCIYPENHWNRLLLSLADLKPDKTTLQMVFISSALKKMGNYF